MAESDAVPRLSTALKGSYHIERELGEGGMATVFLAQDLKHRRKVAVKVLKPELSRFLGTGRFLREIEIAANLRHPHILPLFDSGDAGGLLYYVMPLVAGESLRSRLDRERQLPVADSLQIAREVSDALAYAHEKGVTHRDVKPSNILLERGHAVLTDFGIATAMGAAGEGKRLTHTGMSLGTPVYMSPEQVAGDSALDGRSDQYALGCVLYEMLAGDPPFLGSAPGDVFRQHLFVEPPPVTETRSSVPAPVATALARSLAKSPADRFRTMAEFGGELIDRAYVPTGPIDGRPPMQAPSGPANGASRLDKSAIARWLPRTIGTAAVAALLLAGAVFVIRQPAAGPAQGADPSIASAGSPSSILGSGAGPSIAVLPFRNLSGQDEDEAFVRGVHAEVVAQIGKIRSLDSRSLTSVLRYQGSDKLLSTIGDELGAAYVVDGGVQRVGGTVRINVALHDARTDQQVWGESYDSNLTVTNVLDLQREIALQLAGRLGAEVLPGERARLDVAPPESLLAYELYFEGLFHLRNLTLGQGTVADRRTARNRAFEALEEAVAEDPVWAPSRAALGTLQQWSANSPEDYERSRATFEEALQLDSLYGPAWVGLGYVRHVYERDFPGAEAAHLRAAELGVPSPGGYALLLASWGRWDEAVEAADRAVALDPQSPTTRSNRAYIHMCSGDFQQAVSELEQIRASWPEHEYPRARAWLARSYVGIGEEQRGLAEFNALRRSAFTPDPGQLAHLYSVFDSTETAEDLLLQSERDAEPVTYWHAAAAASLGDRDRAFQYLDRAVEEAYPGIVYALCTEISDLAGDPRYDRFLERLGIPGDP